MAAGDSGNDILMLEGRGGVFVCVQGVVCERVVYERMYKGRGIFVTTCALPTVGVVCQQSNTHVCVPGTLLMTLYLSIGGHPSVVVGNAQPDLVNWLVQQPQSDSKVLFAEGMFARGIIEGLARHGLY